MMKSNSSSREPVVRRQHLVDFVDNGLGFRRVKLLIPDMTRLCLILRSPICPEDFISFANKLSHEFRS